MSMVTYKEASLILDKHISTIEHAIARNVFTIIPTIERKYLIKEQVELFKGKKQLSLRSLSPKEIKLWQKYRDETTPPTPPTTPSPSFDSDEIAEEIAEKVRERLASLFVTPSSLQEAQNVQRILSSRLEKSKQVLDDETLTLIQQHNIEGLASIIEKNNGGRYTHDEAVTMASYLINFLDSMNVVKDATSNTIKETTKKPLQTNSNAS